MGLVVRKVCQQIDRSRMFYFEATPSLQSAVTVSFPCFKHTKSGLEIGLCLETDNILVEVDTYGLEVSVRS